MSAIHNIAYTAPFKPTDTIFGYDYDRHNSLVCGYHCVSKGSPVVTLKSLHNDKPLYVSSGKSKVWDGDQILCKLKIIFRVSLVDIRLYEGRQAYWKEADSLNIWGLLIDSRYEDESFIGNPKDFVLSVTKVK